MYDRAQRLHDEERKSVHSAIKELSDKLEAVTKAKEQEASKRADAQEQLKELRANSEKLRSQVG